MAVEARHHKPVRLTSCPFPIFSPEDGSALFAASPNDAKGAQPFLPKLGKWLAGGDLEHPRYNLLMDEKQLAAKLGVEGFSHTYTWQDGPGAHYPDHTHLLETAHVILTGEMTLVIGGRATIYRPGDRCDVPAGTVHSACMGPEGCRYLIGER